MCSALPHLDDFSGSVYSQKMYANVDSARIRIRVLHSLGCSSTSSTTGSRDAARLLSYQCEWLGSTICPDSPLCMLARARSFVSCRVMPLRSKIISLFTEARMLETRGLQISQPSPWPWLSRSSSKDLMPTVYSHTHTPRTTPKKKKKTKERTNARTTD